MKLEFFQLKQHPFTLYPDPRVVFYSSSHARVKSFLSYASWKWDGYTVITGEPGTGKTLLVKQLLNRLQGKVSCVYLQHSRLNDVEFLRLLLANLGKVAFDAGKAKLISLIHQELLKNQVRGQRCLLVVDDAHHLSAEVLEEIRFLTGFGHGRHALLNVVLVGDDRLLETLNHPGMAQFNQRVRFWSKLEPLTRKGTTEYINFRLLAAGGFGQLYSENAISLIHHFANGVPRLINMLCEVALVAAYVKGVPRVGAVEVQVAINDLSWPEHAGRALLGKKKQVQGRSVEPVALTTAASGILPRISICRNGALLDDLPLDVAQITIGKLPDNDFTLHDPLACDHHAVINRSDKGYVIEDLDSVSGTYVNDNPVRAHLLQYGDEITVASYELKFEAPRKARPPVAALSVEDGRRRSDVLMQVRWEGAE